ncbi:MAG: helix-turn-helix domain-containing protein [Cyclobacteriaceae bacterium]|nr:helix-turn-helix domain-containing protein [Cyclobacteriaceae bacterium]
MKVIPFQVPKISKEAFRIQVDSALVFYDKLHHHPETQIMYIKSGAGTLIAGDYVGRFTSGNLFLIGSNQPHVFKSDEIYYEPKSKLRSNSISLYFEEKYAGENFWQMNELADIRQFILNAGVGYRIEGETKVQLIGLIEEVSNAKSIERLIVFMQLLKTLSESHELKPLSATNSQTLFTANEGKRMNDILQFTFRESHRKIKTLEVAEVANLSPAAFCRYFKVRTRKTYTNFLNEVRISHACKLLIEGDPNIQSVCYKVGFHNLSHFNRQFKKVTGKTPSRYIRPGI